MTFSSALRRSLAMDSIQGRNANGLCRNFNFFDRHLDAAEMQFSSVEDRQCSWTTRDDAGHYLVLNRELLDERWSPGHGIDVEFSWPQLGWKHVNSTANDGSDSSIVRLHRSWDGLTNAIPCHKRSLNSNIHPLKHEVKIEDDGSIANDVRPISNESFPCSSSWDIFTSKISRNSDICAASKFGDDLKSLCPEDRNSWDCEASQPSNGEMKQSHTAVSEIEHARRSAFLPDIKGNETSVPQIETTGAGANKISASDQQGRLLSVIEEIGAGGHANDSNLTRGSAVPNGTAGDTTIGLKLGRRTYFEDSSGGGLPKGRTSDPCSTNSPPGKKHKTSSPGGSPPRCQADGCKADLTSSKDYHRRHKVCELHAKASKVKVVGMEQRFCQQCSRFHGLSAFDEGKRSCRRRLAGHNERRRKSHPPESVQSEAWSYFRDGKLYDGRFLEGFMQRQMAAPSCLNPAESLVHHLHFPTAAMHSLSSALAQPTRDHVHMFLQNSKIHGLKSAMRQDFAPFKPAGTLNPNLGAVPTSQSLGQTSDSGCAISLLSASPWKSTNATCSLSLEGSPHSSLELLLASNGDLSSEQIAPTSSTRGPFSSGEIAENFAQAHEPLKASTVVIAGSLDARDEKQTEESIVSNFDGNVARIMLQNHEFQGSQGGGRQNGYSTGCRMQI